MHVPTSAQFAHASAKGFQQQPSSTFALVSTSPMSPLTPREVLERGLGPLLDLYDLPHVPVAVAPGAQYILPSVLCSVITEQPISLHTLVNTRPEMIFHIYCDMTQIMRLNILMLFWTIWYVRNEIVHGKAAPPIDVSRMFLCRCISSILNISQNHEYHLVKGKGILDVQNGPGLSMAHSARLLTDLK